MSLSRSAGPGWDCLENRILLLCARTRLDDRQAALLKELLSGPVQWEDLELSALRHGVMPLLYKSLNEGSPEVVPPHFLDRLRGYVKENARRNLFLTGELLRIIRFLREHGIRAIAFKGPVLAVSVYGDLASRGFMDLDLLIRPEEFKKGMALLTSDGYRAVLPHPQVKAAAGFQLDYEYDLVGHDRRARLDLHRKIVPDLFCVPFDYESLWRQAQPIQLGGSEVWTLCPEDLLSVLCIHGAKDQWPKLEGILAVALLISAGDPIDWEKVMRQAPARGGDRLHGLGLWLAYDLLGVPLPEAVLRRIHADPPAIRLAREIGTNFFQQKDRQNIGSKLLFFFSLSRGAGQKMKFLGRLGLTLTRPTENEWRWLPLPGWLFPLYYLLRPLRLAGRYGGEFLRRARRKHAEGEI